mgnify:CR=1 FL=1
MKLLSNIPMKSFIPALLILAGALVSCNNNFQQVQTDIAAPVSVSEIKKGTIHQLVNTTGTVFARAEVQLSSEMAGRYSLQVNPSTGKLYKMGDRVKKGQVIARFEDQEFVNGLGLDAKKLNLEIVKQTQEKQASLYEKGGVTLSELRNAEVSLTNAQLSYDNALLQAQRMEVKATIDGVITDLPYYTQGARVNQNSLVVAIMDYSKMYMEINLPESVISTIKVGQDARVTHYTLPEDTLSGVIDELSPAISAETRTFKGRLVIANPDLLLRPGMFVKSDIVVATASEVVLIPKEVISTTRNRKSVYVVENNTAIQKRITTGLEDELNVEVLTGLNAGESLVTRGFESLREGAKVKVIN